MPSVASGSTLCGRRGRKTIAMLDEVRRLRRHGTDDPFGQPCLQLTRDNGKWTLAGS
jgi:hypothetical protein